MVFTVPAKNSLTVGLLRTAVDIDRYPIAWIDTNRDKLLRQWSSQHPEWLMDKGEKKFRIDDTIPGGGATIETFNTMTKLYTSMSGFKDKDSALKYLERAGFCAQPDRACWPPGLREPRAYSVAARSVGAHLAQAQVHSPVCLPSRDVR
ncbi:hypothetical protein [Nocardia fluminea]|uniref:hypothetical protein n=1 Tax=Nocardia fluminea TaxID=134984 RepID=UPI00340B072F